MSRLRATRLRSYLRSSLWFVPVLCVVIGSILSFSTIAIDRAFNYQAIPSTVIGSPDGVLAILTTVATSMVSLTALVLTITMVVVQLAMGQFSPRIVQRILRDRRSQFAIGLFVATFVHSILTLREVTRDANGQGHVPGVAVGTALFLVLVSIAVLVLYVHHIGLSLRVSSLIELVGKDTRKLIDHVYPNDVESPVARLPGEIRAHTSGVVTRLDAEALVEEAARAGCTLQVVPQLGEFVPVESVLVRAAGQVEMLEERRIRDAIVIDDERTLDQDVAYGLRMLVDIAERSLAESPFQDPTTAVQAIDRLHDILRQLVTRELSDGRYYDAKGAFRVAVPVMNWDAYVHLAFDEIRLAGAGSPQVSRRLVAGLEDLRSIAPRARREVLDAQLALLRETVRRRFDTQRDAVLGLDGDGEGMGERAGVSSVPVRSSTSSED